MIDQTAGRVRTQLNRVKALLVSHPDKDKKRDYLLCISDLRDLDAALKKVEQKLDEIR